MTIRFNFSLLFCMFPSFVQHFAPQDVLERHPDNSLPPPPPAEGEAGRGCFSEAADLEVGAGESHTEK